MTATLSSMRKTYAGLRDRIHVRAVDRALIVLPNRVYGLNESAFRVLSHLQTGGSLAAVIGSAPCGKTARREIAGLLQGLHSLVRDERSACGMGGEKPGLEFRPIKKEFYTYPVLAEFAVTDRCNLRCRFCYLDGKPVVELPTRKAKKIIDKIRDEAQVPFLSFTGGEPLLRDDLDILIAHAKERGLHANLISNGTLISRERVARLRRAGLDSAQISLESFAADIHNRLTGTHSFDQTVRGIDHLLSEGIYVHINTTLNRENQHDPEKFVDKIVSMGVKKFSANMIIPVGRARDNRSLWLRYGEIGPIIERMREAAGARGVEFVWYSPLPYCIYNPMQKGLGSKSCAACHGLVSVNPAGEILPCSCFPRSLGSWLTNDFESLWFSPTALHYRKMGYLHPRCRDCAMREMCAGACPLYWESIGYHEIAG